MFSAQMKHNEKTIQRLAQTQDSAFCWKRRIVQFLISLVLIWIGLFSSINSSVSIVCLLFGCWMVVSIDQPPKNRSKRIIRDIAGNYPNAEYLFHENTISVRNEDGSEQINYDDIFRIIEDDQYIYLFINKYSAYMFSRESIMPNDIEFQAYLQDKIGLKFTKPLSLASINLLSLLYVKKNTKKV